MDIVYTLLFSFLVKLPFLTKPLVGYFGSYQTVNAMMAQMMLNGPWQNFLAPRTFILFNGEPGLHLIYYPWASLAAAILKALSGCSLDFGGHFQAALFMALAGFFFYQSVKKILDRETAAKALFIFSFAPMALTMGISFQNEAAALCFLICSFWMFLFEGSVAGFGAGVLFSLAAVGRLHFISVLPVFLYLWRSRSRKGSDLAAFTAGFLLPLGVFYGFCYFVERSVPAQVMTSLFSQSQEGRILMNPIVLRQAFYLRLGEILGGLWLTPVILPLLIGGILARRKERTVFAIWLFFSLSVIVLLPQKVNDHPFYLLHSIPAASVLAAVGYGFLKPFLRRSLRFLFWAVFILLSLRYYIPIALSGGSDKVRIPEIGKRVQEMTRPDDLIIAVHGSSPDLLYYSGRKGWAFSLAMDKSYVLTSSQARHRKLMAQGYGDPVVWLEKLRKEGAVYLVISEPQAFRDTKAFADYVTRNFIPVQAGEGASFLVFDLKEKRS